MGRGGNRPLSRCLYNCSKNKPSRIDAIQGSTVQQDYSCSLGRSRDTRKLPENYAGSSPEKKDDKVLRRTAGYLSDGQHVDAGAPHGLEETAGDPRGMAHSVADRGHDAARAESNWIKVV